MIVPRHAMGGVEMQDFAASIHDRVLSVVRSILEQNAITADVHPESRLVDIGLGSMDMVALWLKAIGLSSRIEAEPHRLFADVVEEWAQRQPGRPALLSDGQSFTYGELAARINRYARWARSLGIRTGGTVCLLMPNRPDYLACWLGISRVRGTAALINTRLVGRSLAHCIDVARAY